MTSVQTRSASISVSPPEAASRPLLDLVSRFQNRLEDGDRPGHKLISAGLAPLEHERAALEERKQHLLASLAPPASDEARAKMVKIVASLLGAFPTYGADREDARITVGLIVRALDDVPVWAVQKAASLFLKNLQKTRWNPERAPTASQIRAEAKLVMLDVEVELYRIEQVLSAETVDSETTEDQRKAAVAHWNQLKAAMGRSNVIAERTREEIERERQEMRRANEVVEQRDAWERVRAGLPPVPSPFEPRHFRPPDHHQPPPVAYRGTAAMPRGQFGKGYNTAQATPQHNSTIAQDVPLPPERRNKVPNLYAAAVRWYVCTTAPSRELSAAASIRQAALRGRREGETPFAAYVPCEFFWHRAVRSNLRVPRREIQRPILRHYIIVGVLGGLCDDTLAALRERDREGRNVHGLLGILGVSGLGPRPMNGEGLRWLRTQGADEIAGATNRSASSTLQPGEEVRAGSGVFSGFLGKFIGTAKGGTVGVIALDMRSTSCEVRLPIEDVHRAA